MQILEHGSCFIHYRAMPGPAQRPTVVFINSLGTDFRIWDGVVEALGGRYGVVLQDKRGHGLSSLTPRPQSIGDYADDVVALLDHLGLRDVVLCGLSVGGLISQHLLVHRSDLVRAAILSNTAAKLGTDESWNARINTVATSGMTAISQMVMERWFPPAFRQTRRGELALAANMLTRTDAAAYIACCEAIRDADYRPHLGAIARPVLCIAGTHDGAAVPALVRETAAAIPGARFVEFEDAGHIPCIECPERHAQVISEFIGAVESQSSEA